MGPDDATEFLKMARDKIDIVHVSAGILANLETIQHMIQPLYTPHTYNVHLARLVKEKVDLPVTAVGSKGRTQSSSPLEQAAQTKYPRHQLLESLMGRGCRCRPEWRRTECCSNWCGSDGYRDSRLSGKPGESGDSPRDDGTGDRACKRPRPVISTT